MSKHHLTRLEEHIKGFVEGSFARLFAGHLHPRQVALQLARAMEDHARPGARPAAPEMYTVYIHPEDYAALMQAQPDLARALAAHLVDLAARSGMAMHRFPDVTLSPSAEVARHQVRVRAGHAPGAISTTEEMGTLEPEGAPPLNARLVVEGHRTIPLVLPVVNIGRRLDNHIVLDDTRVSRQHAQLRLRQGHYVLFDLGARRGTQVNGQTVETCILRAGDCISFGGAEARYYQDTLERPHQDTLLDEGP